VVKWRSTLTAGASIDDVINEVNEGGCNNSHRIINREKRAGGKKKKKNVSYCDERKVPMNEFEEYSTCSI